MKSKLGAKQPLKGPKSDSSFESTSKSSTRPGPMDCPHAQTGATTKPRAGETLELQLREKSFCEGASFLVAHAHVYVSSLASRPGSCLLIVVIGQHLHAVGTSSLGVVHIGRSRGTANTSGGPSGSPVPLSHPGTSQLSQLYKHHSLRRVAHALVGGDLGDGGGSKKNTLQLRCCAWRSSGTVDERIGRSDQFSGVWRAPSGRWPLRRALRAYRAMLGLPLSSGRFARRLDTLLELRSKHVSGRHAFGRRAFRVVGG